MHSFSSPNAGKYRVNGHPRSVTLGLPGNLITPVLELFPQKQRGGSRLALVPVYWRLRRSAFSDSLQRLQGCENGTWPARLTKTADLAAHFGRFWRDLTPIGFISAAARTGWQFGNQRIFASSTRGRKDMRLSLRSGRPETRLLWSRCRRSPEGKHRHCRRVPARSGPAGPIDIALQGNSEKCRARASYGRASRGLRGNAIA
jgi:hypothetical protein